MFRKIDKFSGRGRFDRWLYRVAINEAYQLLRRRQRREHPHLAYEPVDRTIGGDERTEQKELMEHDIK